MTKYLSLALSLVFLGAVAACSSAGDAVKDKAASFAAQKAAIGTWTCEPRPDDFLSPAKVVVAVESDHTFTVLEDTRPNNAVSPDSPLATGSWRVVDGNLKIEAGGETGRFEDFDSLAPGKNSIQGFFGIEDDVDVDITSSSEFAIMRTPTDETAQDDGSPWTCKKG